MNILKDFFFEKISGADDAIIPTRATKESAGYDFYSLQDTIIPSYANMLSRMTTQDYIDRVRLETNNTIPELKINPAFTWDEMESLTKRALAKTTLIPTGIKCHLPSGYFLHLSLRSSSPNKHWLVIANAPGIVDCDYYNNPDNEGHIYFQVINLSPFDITIPARTKFGQGIVLPYCITENDDASNARTGGFGSTN